MKRSGKGFTLVELIVVLAILAVLASLVTVNAAGVLARERVLRIQADLKLLEVAGNQYLETSAGQGEAEGSELTQAALVAQGLLRQTLSPPLAGYHYRIEVGPRRLARVVMENGEGVYHYGDFTADTQAAGFS